jgi:hypothetical protein
MSPGAVEVGDVDLGRRIIAGLVPVGDLGAIRGEARIEVCRGVGGDLSEVLAARIDDVDVLRVW